MRVKGPHHYKVTVVGLCVKWPLLVLATNERFLPTWVTFRIGLASENHRLQPMLALTVHWWPAPVSVGELLVTNERRYGEITS